MTNRTVAFETCLNTKRGTKCLCLVESYGKYFHRSQLQLLGSVTDYQLESDVQPDATGGSSDAANKDPSNTRFTFV